MGIKFLGDNFLSSSVNYADFAVLKFKTSTKMHLLANV